MECNDNGLKPIESTRDRGTIPAKIDTINAVTNTLEIAIKELRDRIEPVLVPNEPTPGNTTGDDRPTMSTVASVLDDHIDTLLNLVYTVEAVSRRVDL